MSLQSRRTALESALLAAVVTLTAGCADRLAEDRAESEIRRMLPGVLGPADSYDVNVDGTSSGILKGRMRRVDVTARNARPAGLPQMARLDVTLTDFNLDLDKKEVLSGKAAWSGCISEAEMERLADGHFSYLRDIKLELEAGSVEASGKLEYRGMGPSGTITAVPDIRRKREIWLTPKRVEVLGLDMGLPQWTQDRLSEIVNPIYVVPETRLGITLTRIEAVKEQIRLEGTFDPKGLTKAGSRS